MSEPIIRERGSGIVLVVSAPSGTGKSTLLGRLMKKVGGVRFSVSFTTRPIRDGEENGRDYHFIGRERFEEMRAAGEFLEWAEVHGEYYGTARSQVQAILDGGQDVLLDVDVQGAEEVRRSIPEAALVFLLPPSYQQLHDRLRGRGTSAEELLRRMKNARDEVKRAEQFDYLVVNDVLEEAAVLLEAIMLAERSRRVRRHATWDRVLSTFAD
jgi:guanylate kinase